MVPGAVEASVAAEDLVAAVGADLVAVAAAALVAVDLAVAVGALVAGVASGEAEAVVAHENCHRPHRTIHCIATLLCERDHFLFSEMARLL